MPIAPMPAAPAFEAPPPDALTVEPPDALTDPTTEVEPVAPGPREAVVAAKTLFNAASAASTCLAASSSWRSASATVGIPSARLRLVAAP